MTAISRAGAIIPIALTAGQSPAGRQQAESTMILASSHRPSVEAVQETPWAVAADGDASQGWEGACRLPEWEQRTSWSGQLTAVG